MKRRYDYKVCPICGASLDIGEECDCEDDIAHKTPKKPQKATKAYKICVTAKDRLKQEYNHV